MRLYLIRHGQSTNNALEDQTYRTQDPDLTDLGWQQAERVATYLANTIEMATRKVPERELQESGFGITHLYCSPMRRALQTAQPIARALKMTPEVQIAIHEIGGIFLADQDDVVTGYPGMLRSQIEAEFPGYVLPDTITEDGWWKPEDGRERLEIFMSRAIRVVLELRERARTSDRIVMVTHAAFMDALIKAILDQLPRHPATLFYAHYNTGITRFDFEEGMDRMRLHYLNRTEHLPPELRSW